MAARHGSRRHPGSVRKRPDRPGYEARVTLPNRKRVSAYFDTEKEGWNWIAKRLVEAEKGIFLHKETQKTGDALEEWLETVAPKTLHPNSLYNYRLCIGYVLPWIGAIKLTDLKRPDIECTFARLERGDETRGPLSRSTLNLTFRVLKQALEYCVEAEYIAKNPVGRMKAPKVPPGKGRVLTVEEVHAILEEAQGTRWYAALYLVAMTGLRVSELLGLEWKNLDLERGVVTVDQQTGRVIGEPGVRLTRPKTDTSQRSVRIAPSTCQVLRWHQDLQRLERKRAMEDGVWEDHGLVFCSEEGKPYFRSQPGTQFRRIADRLGIEDATIHTFRHTVTTVLQEGGLPLRTAQNTMGHATDRTTHRIYSHATPQGMEAVASVMEDWLGDTALPQDGDGLTTGEAQ